MKKGIAILASVIALTLLSVFLIHSNSISPSKVDQIRIGYTSSPLLAPLFAAEDISPQSGGAKILRLLPFSTSGDVGYALISGDLDAGFVEVSKAVKLLTSPQGKELRPIGSLQFPYGATLVIRKDLQLRLGDIKGLRIAARNTSCNLLKQFETDAKRFNVDWDSLKFTYIDFDAMIPALESGSVDAAVLKGSYALLAQKLGHKILYQNWNVKGGEDECCPPSISQIEYLLITKASHTDEVGKRLYPLFEKVASLPLDQIRKITSANISYPEDALSEFPISVFKVLSSTENEHLFEKEKGHHEGHDHK